MDDEYFMRTALNYAARGIGRAWPNPSVGCAIVKNGYIVAMGRTHEGGRPHAEAEALARAGSKAAGATAYVTLEPCAIRGRGEPCSKALIEAGVKRVVIACIDPNPVVNGQGIKNLENAGVKVTYGVLENEAKHMNKGFFMTHESNRPWVTLKLAISADGAIAKSEGVRTQISGEMATRYMHNLRSRHDAIMVGSNTAKIDAPKLTTRIKGYEHNIRRFIASEKPITASEGIETIYAPTIKEMLAQIAAQGITRILVEGGPKLHQTFLDEGYADCFKLIRSPIELGENAVKAPYIGKLNEYGFKLAEAHSMDEDVLEIYRKDK
ncbi:MAG: bifunctional diaminohydroxyphosphoribosylaminopyrimidine deaminase/5-amino-6-(5-phosphoribosylamino)uracil reductase RibD [Micavibrio sp.]|nr:bifunctional diaminohydroxyphosphoribosylaminopyrimidine deaminase/5-amino-6-(5-phosphoribosylamino)uracil reductase RibD [Micavibrio sp.]